MRPISASSTAAFTTVPMSSVPSGSEAVARSACHAGGWGFAAALGARPPGVARLAVGFGLADAVVTGLAAGFDLADAVVPRLAAGFDLVAAAVLGVAAAVVRCLAAAGFGFDEAELRCREAVGVAAAGCAWTARLSLRRAGRERGSELITVASDLSLIPGFIVLTQIRS
jgi:hypothetical protein